MTKALAAIAVAVAVVACGGSGDFGGTTFESQPPAPDFTLTDQLGSSISLSDHVGEVVVLTFLYTSCPDICPVIADHLIRIQADLEGTSEDASILIVSVDPERDGVKQAREYSEAYGMLSKWSFLVGDADTLAEVWASYYVSPSERSDGDHSVDSLLDAASGEYLVDHQAPVYVIDREGRKRAVYTLPFDPDDVVARVRSLQR